MPGHVSVLFVFGVAALSACHHDGPEDAAIAASTAIPMGALGAVGVSFDAPPAPSGAATAPPHVGKPKSGLRPLPAVPLDPFADPSEPSDDAGTAHHPRPHGGTVL